VLLLIHIWLVVQATKSTLQAKQLPSKSTRNHLHVHIILLKLKLLPIATPNPEPTHLQAL
jgi:hypothetical protein